MVIYQIVSPTVADDIIALCLGNVAAFASEAAKPQVKLETVIIRQK